MKTKTRIALLIVAFITTTFVNAQKKESPATTATGVINGANITINYGSPSVKERKIWGTLVPYNEVWRAGANDATTFETDKKLTIEGKELPAGKYAFFIIPKEKECVIIFNKEAKQWGSYKYDEKKDQLRVTVKQQKSAALNEKLVYKVEKNKVVVSWENWDIPISVK
ncbi:DUF2911 domain-containing protein [Flavobacterium sp. '19STA2R22 D10 B1']|uniref:DUF2911 domain-containing protein n=1 Tax=Flavobacterium aerium TaxID=3037261 RepID=UPI00278C4950|nr:DUF2911 domain-containing protein [Flavobacterium sp. '19STA2R22 D10 B1']